MHGGADAVQPSPSPSPPLPDTNAGWCTELLTPKLTIADNAMLVVVDMQKDFITGSLSAPGAQAILVPRIVRLIEAFERKPIILTRDAHPEGHCSFESEAKPGFPEHCIQGKDGSRLDDTIWKAVQNRGGKTIHAFKGYMQNQDSFSAFPYTDGHALSKGLRKNDIYLEGGSLAATGALCLKEECNAKADANANNIVSPTTAELTASAGEYEPINDVLTNGILSKCDTIYVCGLVADYCVLDTAVMAKVNFPNKTVVYLSSYTRPSGVWSIVGHDPLIIRDTLHDADVELTNAMC